jgi:hypothetical protein
MDKDQVSAAPADREAWMKEAERLAHEMQRKYHNAMVWSSRENAEDPPPAKAAWQEYQAARALLLLHISTAAPAVQQDGWMPIESAPKKGLVDIWSDGRRFTECWRDPVCSEYRCLGNSNVLITLPLASCTHWRQPPPPPAAIAGESDAEWIAERDRLIDRVADSDAKAAKYMLDEAGRLAFRRSRIADLLAHLAKRPAGVAPVEAQSSDVNAIVTIATAALDRILDGFIKDVNVRFTLRDEFIEALEIEAEEHGRTAGVKAPAATPPNCCPQCMGEGWVELKRLCKKHGSGVPEVPHG